MTGLGLLWLPILVSAVAVFIASSFIHTVAGWHRNDFPKLPNEDQVRAALRPLGIPPGDYCIPRPASREDLKSQAFLEKMKEGPVAMLTVRPNGTTGMGRSLILWFFYCLVIGLFAAYIAGAALPPGSPYRRVFRFAGATAFIGYAAALWQMSIWYWRSWSTTLKMTFDGLIYGLLTAGIFGWLWPK
jgi:hypothetical protein